MTTAEKFQEWKAAHYPNATRIDTQKMYAAWCAGQNWKPQPSARPPTPPKQKSKPEERETT